MGKLLILVPLGIAVLFWTFWFVQRAWAFVMVGVFGWPALGYWEAAMLLALIFLAGAAFNTGGRK